MELKLTIDEDKIKEIVKKRKRIEKTKLCIRRAITLMINIVVLLIGWSQIIIIHYYDDEISNYF
jgi:hypothetical protein